MTTIQKFSDISLGKIYKIVSIKDDAEEENVDLDECYLKSIGKYINCVVLIKAIVKLNVRGYEYIIGKIMSSDYEETIIEFFQDVNNKIRFPIFYDSENISHMFPSDDIMLNGSFPNYGFPHNDCYLQICLEEIEVDDI